MFNIKIHRVIKHQYIFFEIFLPTPKVATEVQVSLIGNHHQDKKTVVLKELSSERLTRSIMDLQCNYCNYLGVLSERKEEARGGRKEHREWIQIVASFPQGPLTTAPRVPFSMFFSTPGDGGAELMSVMSDVTSVRSEVMSEVMSELTSELCSDSTPLDLGKTWRIFMRNWGGVLREANLW